VRGWVTVLDPVASLHEAMTEARDLARRRQHRARVIEYAVIHSETPQAAS
jgi:hypothetical protein